MALWGELGIDNRILRVTVGNDNDSDRGYSWLIENLGGRWIEVSNDGSVGDYPAGIGSYYCDTHNSFACEHGCNFGDFWREQRNLKVEDAAQRTWFMGRVFACDPRKYIPPLMFDDMCYAVETIVSSRPDRVADIGSGIGTLGVTIGAETGSHVVFVEPDSDLLSITKKNAENYGVNASFLDGVATDLFGSFDAIISDAPCWPSDSPEVEVYGYAANGGIDGLHIVRDVVAVAEKCLSTHGLLALRFPAAPLLIDNPAWTDVVCENGIVIARRS